MKRKPGVAVLGSLVGAIALLGAGRPPDQGPSQTAPVFRGGVDFVSVDVVVTDSKNHPISDLTATDFPISEHGRPQKISDFKYISIPVAHWTIDLKQPPTPPPDVATNVLPSPNSRLFVMVVDDLHLIESQIIPVTIGRTRACAAGNQKGPYQILTDPDASRARWHGSPSRRRSSRPISVVG